MFSGYKRLELENFTAFQKLGIDFVSGINVFIGANATGKTHVLKLLYCALDYAQTGQTITDKLLRVFLPFEGRVGRLVKRQQGSSQAVLRFFSEDARLSTWFSNHSAKKIKARWYDTWGATVGSTTSVYLPVKEMLANAPGFRSQYALRQLHFEQVYSDILDRAFVPPLRGPADAKRRTLMAHLERVIEGRVISKGETFFLKNKQGELEFTLLAEGLRKLGLLWLLIQNGTLTKGSVLFWDEPEANMNPMLMETVVDILLELQRMGVQIFLATHHYQIIKRLAIQKRNGDQVRYHAFFRDQKAKAISCSSFDRLEDVEPNAILESYVDLYDREIDKVMRP